MSNETAGRVPAKKVTITVTLQDSGAKLEIRAGSIRRLEGTEDGASIIYKDEKGVFRRVTTTEDYEEVKEMFDDAIEAASTAGARADGWILCSQEKPAEHDSIFKRFKGMNAWRDNMFETISDSVDVTVLYTDGSRRTDIGHTVEGSWRTSRGMVEKGVVIAWKPRPEPYQGPTE